MATICHSCPNELRVSSIWLQMLLYIFVKSRVIPLVSFNTWKLDLFLDFNWFFTWNAGTAGLYLFMDGRHGVTSTHCRGLSCKCFWLDGRSVGVHIFMQSASKLTAFLAMLLFFFRIACGCFNGWLKCPEMIEVMRVVKLV